MACERDALSDVAAGAAATPALGAHLASCEACRAELAALRRALSIADEEMARLLTVEPAPDLAARIRTAVAESGTRSAPVWRAGWLWPALATAAVLVVVLAVIMLRPPSPAPGVAVGTRPSLQPSGARHTPGPAPEPLPQTAVAETAPPGSAPRPQPRPSLHRAVPAEPEVLVPRGEAEALLRFVALVHRERLTPAALGAVDQPAADLAELAPIEIQPLEIVPLDPAESSGTQE